MLASVKGRCRVVMADASALPQVEPLFRAMVDHHRLVAGADWPVRDAGHAWARRRSEYVDWLAGGNAWLLLALPVDSRAATAAVGYAFVRLHEPGATWDLGEEVGELESLSVAEEGRGAGVGTILIDQARQLLARRGIRYWSVGVVETNAAAVRLYEREGFRPYYRNMLAAL
jgi:ribosomal protein S18 acetylase RimI-like enzyme